MTKEIFKDIPNYEGLYQVSNLGRVKSLERTIIRKNGINLSVREKILTPCIGTHGYYVINLYKNRKRKHFLVHHLVSIVFLNYVPNKITVIDHKDNNRLNNSILNLQIITHRENASKKTLNNASIFVGVCWKKEYQKWVARICFNGKRHHLGYFKDEYQAHLAYQKALNELT